MLSMKFKAENKRQNSRKISYNFPPGKLVLIGRGTEFRQKISIYGRDDHVREKANRVEIILQFPPCLLTNLPDLYRFNSFFDIMNTQNVGAFA